MHIRSGRALVAVLIAAGVSGALAGPARATGNPTLLTDFAGNGAGNFLQGAPTPGPATAAELSYPTTPRFDTHGNLYVADGVAETVDKIGPDGIISTVAGTGIASGTIPTAGPALSTNLDYPDAVVPDTAGGFYLADYDHAMVDHVDAAGNLTITAGTGVYGHGAVASPGLATSAHLSQPSGLALDASGNLYIADTDSDVVYEVDTTGQLSVFAGGGNTPESATPVSRTSAMIFQPNGINFGADGTLYIADTGGGDIDAVSTTGQLTRIAGTGGNGSIVVDGPALSTQFGYPMDVAVGSDGTVYTADADGAVAKISGGTITVIAGNGSSGSPTFDSDPLTTPVGGPCGITVDADGNVYFGDWNNGYIDKIGVASGPSAPRNLVAAQGVSVDSADLTFDPPVYTDGVTVTGYEVSTDGGVTWTPITTTGSGPITASVSGLSGGSRAFLVRAVSSYGSGNSASATATIIGLPVAATPIRSTTALPTAVTPKPAAKPTPLPSLAVPLAKRHGEVAVPAQVLDYHGALRHTVVDGRSRKGINAFAISTLKGYQLHKGQAATLDNGALFAFDSAKLTVKGRAELKKLAASLTSARAISCEGYTDYGASAHHQLSLSQGRAQAVCAALRADGAPVRTTVSGYGGTRPVVVGGTAAQRSANRRVVIVVTA